MPWKIIEQKKLQYTVRFTAYSDAIAFINAVANIAERQNHHPDLYNSFSTVIVEIYTHALDGLSAKDFALAAAIEPLFPQA